METRWGQSDFAMALSWIQFREEGSVVVGGNDDEVETKESAAKSSSPVAAAMVGDATKYARIAFSMSASSKMQSW